MDRLEIKIPKELKQEFKAWCDKTVTTPSDELRRYIARLVKEDKSR
ncbi:MAG: hypothetical protein H6Q69_4980 [Firmicutes bacterium]|nr:hypothetical protein [Bacillota bacterium]